MITPNRTRAIEHVQTAIALAAANAAFAFVPESADKPWPHEVIFRPLDAAVLTIETVLLTDDLIRLRYVEIGHYEDVLDKERRKRAIYETVASTIGHLVCGPALSAARDTRLYRSRGSWNVLRHLSVKDDRGNRPVIARS
jgi:hypothetical protein